MRFTTVDVAALQASLADVHATRAEKLLAHRAGTEAQAASLPNAPGIDRTIRSLVSEAAVSEPRTLELFHEFQAGWQTAAETEG